MRNAHIIVNLPDNQETEYVLPPEYFDWPVKRIEASFPEWTSMVITLVREVQS